MGLIRTGIPHRVPVFLWSEPECQLIVSSLRGSAKQSYPIDAFIIMACRLMNKPSGYTLQVLASCGLSASIPVRPVIRAGLTQLRSFVIARLGEAILPNVSTTYRLRTQSFTKYKQADLWKMVRKIIMNNNGIYNEIIMD